MERSIAGNLPRLARDFSSVELPAHGWEYPAVQISERIQARLDELQISANKASLRAGLPRDAIRDILSGKSRHPRADTLLKIAAALEIDPSALLDPAHPTGGVRPLPSDQRVLPIRYEVAAGSWQAHDELRQEPYGYAPANVEPEYEGIRQWLERVRGDSGYKTHEGATGRFHVTDLHVAMRRCPKPIVAMVAGWAIGGGHVLHLVCDLTIAADNARFGQVGPKVGSFDGGYGAGLLADLKSIANLIVPDQATSVPAPEVVPGQRLEWPEFHKLNRALDDTFADPGAPFLANLFRALTWVGLVEQSQLNLVGGARIEDYLHAIRNAAAQDNPSDVRPLLPRVAAPSTAGTPPRQSRGRRRSVSQHSHRVQLPLVDGPATTTASGIARRR